MKRTKLIASAAIVIAVGAISSVAAIQYDPDPDITFCHYSNGEWDLRVLEASKLDGSGHTTSHSNDIIRAFAYRDQKGVQHAFLGVNEARQWSGYYGGEILDNGCVIP